MLQTILSITGRPGLYKLVSRGRNMLIVESLIDKKRRPAYSNEKAVSLKDIAMYTEDNEVPLAQILMDIKTKENGGESSLNPKGASTQELADYFETVLPNYDRERVHSSDIKKLISWYNLLVKSGNSNFEEDIKEEKGEEPETAKEKDAEEAVAQNEKKATKAAPKKTSTAKTAKKVSAKPAMPKTTVRKSTVRKTGDK